MIKVPYPKNKKDPTQQHFLSISISLWPYPTTSSVSFKFLFPTPKHTPNQTLFSDKYKPNFPPLYLLHIYMKRMKPHSDNPLSLPNVSDVTCMDPSRPSLVVEKLCKTVRLICFLVHNGVSKSKVMHDVNFVMKRGKNLGKTLNNAVVRHHEALTCRSRDSQLSYVSPLEYQFSCSGSPPRLSHHGGGRRKGGSPIYTRRQNHHALQYSRVPQGHRISGLCRGDEDAVVGSGVGGCTTKARVKITGPTSMLNDDVLVEREYRVDEAAEEFIERFYRDLRLQKWLDHCC